jgi:ABC-type molybdenum transport system ATPase subunit/photorepair protein PhrA
MRLLIGFIALANQRLLDGDLINGAGKTTLRELLAPTLFGGNNSTSRFSDYF